MKEFDSLKVMCIPVKSKAVKAFESFMTFCLTTCCVFLTT